jgi:hypothetical protein
MRAFATIAAVLCLATPALAWDGTDANTGSDVEIGSGNLVRPGQSIEVYDYGTGEYRNVTVDDVTSYGGTVDVDVTDDNTGESTTLEMNGN